MTRIVKVPGRPCCGCEFVGCEFHRRGLAGRRVLGEVGERGCAGEAGGRREGEAAVGIDRDGAASNAAGKGPERRRLAVEVDIVGQKAMGGVDRERDIGDDALPNDFKRDRFFNALFTEVKIEDFFVISILYVLLLLHHDHLHYHVYMIQHNVSNFSIFFHQFHHQMNQ